MKLSTSRGTICALLVAGLVLGSVTHARAQSQVPCYSYDENCKGLIKKGMIITAVAVGALIAWKIMSGHNKTAKANAAPGRLNVHFDPTNGQALFHVVMTARANCGGSWTTTGSRKVSGKFPPGMELDDNVISGTPDVPGTWTAGVQFSGLICEGRDGKSRSYSDQTVNVTINIAE